MDGSRTHRGPHGDPPPILKTGEPTGTHPFPRLRIPQPEIIDKVERAVVIDQKIAGKVIVIQGTICRTTTPARMPSRMPATTSDK